MACNDNPKFIDRITSFGNKSTRASKQPGRTNSVVSDLKGMKVSHRILNVLKQATSGQHLHEFLY